MRNTFIALVLVAGSAVAIWLWNRTGSEPPMPSPASSLTAAAPVLSDNALPSLSLSGLPDAAGNPGVVFRGTILDDRGEPLGGATVTANDVSARTNDDGAFRIEVPRSERYMLSVTHPDFRPLEMALEAAPAPMHLRLVRGGSISGVVENSEGQPVARVDVGIEGDALHHAVTDAMGRFALNGLSNGQVTVVAASRGQPPVGGRETFFVVGRGLSDVHLNVHAIGTIAGTVEMDPLGPVPKDLYLVAVPADIVHSPTHESRARSARVGENGAFELSFLTPGAYDVSVGYSGETSTRVRLYTGNLSAHIVVPRGTPVTGRVIDAQGEPVTAFSIDSKPYESATGEFELTLRAGPRDLYFESRGYVPVFRHLAIGSSAAVSVGDVVMGGGLKLTLSVVQAGNQQPLNGARVFSLSTWDSMFRDGDPLGTTGADGRATLRGLAPDDTLVVTHEGYAAERVTCANGELEKRVALTRGSKLTVRVLDASSKPVAATVDCTDTARPAEAPSQLAEAATGEAVFVDLPPGQWLVTAHLHDSKVVRGAIAIARGESKRLELQAPGQTTRLTLDTPQLPPGNWSGLLLHGSLAEPRNNEELRRVAELSQVTKFLSPLRPTAIEDVAPGSYLLLVVRDNLEEDTRLFSFPLTVSGGSEQVVTVPVPSTFRTLAE